MPQEPAKRLVDSQDALIAALYAKRDLNSQDTYPLLTNTNGELLIAGNLSVSLSGTESTINNAPGNPVNVALTETRVTAHLSPSASVATVHFSPSASAVTAALSETRVTAHISTSASVVTVHISPTASIVTIAPQAGSTLSTTTRTLHISPSASVTTAHLSPSASVATVHISPSASEVTAALSQTRVSVTVITGQNGVDGNVGAVSAATQRFVEAINTGRTLTGCTVSISATTGTVTTAGTNRIKVYAVSVTTTATTSSVLTFVNGTYGGLVLWRAVLQAPSGANAGLNLAVTPPAYLFATSAATLLRLNLSASIPVEVAVSYFDEA